MIRLALVIAFALATQPAHAGMFPRTYDKTIRRAAEQWLPAVPWKLLKAQLAAESRLNPYAHSPVGAEGIAQFMPDTWAEVSRALGYRAIPPTAAEPAIAAAGYYMAQVKKRWGAAELERHKLGLASYNAGGGNVSRAARLCGGADTWDDVAPCLQEVTGKHSAETISYVRRIWSYWAAMEAER